jgi:hypothetical protein
VSAKYQVRWPIDALRDLQNPLGAYYSGIEDIISIRNSSAKTAVEVKAKKGYAQ